MNDLQHVHFGFSNQRLASELLVFASTEKDRIPREIRIYLRAAAIRLQLAENPTIGELQEAAANFNLQLEDNRPIIPSF